MPETIAPPSGPAISLADLPRKNTTNTSLPSSILAAAKAAAGEPPDPEPPKEPAEPAPASPAPTAAKPEPKHEPVAPKEPPKEPAKEPIKKKEGIEAVREALERQTAKVKELENSASSTTKERADALQKLAEFEAKVAKYEKSIKEDYEPRVARLTEVEKKLQEREEALRIRDYTATTEWHEKHVKPLITARADTEALLSELEVSDPSTGTSRRATGQDFDAVLAAPTLNEAAKIARALFGDDVYQSVVQQRNRIKSLVNSQQEALKNAQLESQEYFKRQQSAEAEAREMLRNRLTESQRRIMEEEKDIFTIPEGDTELAEALRDGFELADMASGGKPDMTRDQFADTVARARTEIAASKLLRKQIGRVRAENAELKKQLEAYQKSEPDVIPRGGQQPSGAPKTAKDSLLEAATRLATRL